MNGADIDGGNAKVGWETTGRFGARGGALDGDGGDGTGRAAGSRALGLSGSRALGRWGAGELGTGALGNWGGWRAP
ncbi:hypothetical protein DF044_33470 [Burkholderia contaminans]|nr:hypothetical protein DF044_33470 [Burkholderia contaminans]